MNSRSIVPFSLMCGVLQIASLLLPDVDSPYIEVACLGKQAQKRHHQLQIDAGPQRLNDSFQAAAAKALDWLAAMGADEAIAQVPFDRFEQSASVSAVAENAQAPGPSTAQPRPSLNHRPSAPAAAPPAPRSPAPAAATVPAEELDAMATRVQHARRTGPAA
jgi:hypothetical protein